MRTSILIIVFSFSFTTILFAQDFKRWGMSSNLVSDLVLFSPDIQLNYYMNQHSVVSVGGSYGWWNFSWRRKWVLQQWLVKAEYNYYLKDDYSFLGHHLGASAQTGQVDGKKNKSAKRGQITTAGLLYGYTWSPRKNLYFDAGIGFGYLYTFLHDYKYEPTKGYYCISHPTKHRFGLTNLNLSVIYRFNLKKKK